MVADLACDPGGEAITKARKAQVDLAVRERLASLVGSRWTTAAAGSTQQQRTHPPLPDPPLRADQQQLGRGQSDGVGLGAYQLLARGEVVGGQRSGDLVSEPSWLAVPAGPGDHKQVIAARLAEQDGGGIALQQPQHGRGAQIIAG
jgi:hypothetical protein